MRTFAFLIALALAPLAVAQDKPAAPVASPGSATAQPGPSATPLPDTPPKPAAAAPAPKPAAAPAPAATVTTKPVAAAPAAAPKPMSPGRKAKREEDARHCLEKGSNSEIIKCAEAYL